MPKQDLKRSRVKGTFLPQSLSRMLRAHVVETADSHWLFSDFPNTPSHALTCNLKFIKVLSYWDLGLLLQRTWAWFIAAVYNSALGV